MGSVTSPGWQYTRISADPFSKTLHNVYKHPDLFCKNCMQYGCKYLTENVKELIVDQHPEFNIIFNRLKTGIMVLDRSNYICPHLTGDPAVDDTATNVLPISRPFHKKPECAAHPLMILCVK